jgi:hypothetical protein
MGQKVSSLLQNEQQELKPMRCCGAKANNRMNIDNDQPFFNRNVSINIVVKECKI